ncbi:MAG: hypothetical protein QNK33_02190 [Bacteroidales bacterium]|nr:hypothetical protein [Bacteroidales bacterium]
MIRTIRILLTITIVLVLIPGQLLGQELNIKLANKHIIKSSILGEDREILVHLPENYDKSDKTYKTKSRFQ